MTVKRNFFWILAGGFLVLAGFFPRPVKAGLTRVWAVDDGEKILKEDLEHPLATSSLNKVWQGGTVNLFGAKNEIIAFQLILQGDGSGLGNVKVELPSLKQVGGSYSIDNSKAQDADDPFNYVGKRIEVFVEHYLNIDANGRSNSEGSWGYTRSYLRSNAYYLGYVPDALIPVESPKFSSGFTVEANKNQGVWFDLYLPKDAPAGTYTGAITVKSGSTVVKTVPVSLTVYDFTLPEGNEKGVDGEAPYLANMFYFAPYENDDISTVHENLSLYYSLKKRYGMTYSFSDSRYLAIEKAFYQTAHRHRMDLAQNMEIGEINAHPYFKGYLTGNTFTKNYGYEGPGAGVGIGTYPLGVYSSWRAGFDLTGDDTADRKVWQTQADAWVNWFRANAPKVDYFYYMEPDEPRYVDGVNQIDGVIKRAKWLHGNTGVGKDLPVFVSMLGFLLDEKALVLADDERRDAGCGEIFNQKGVGIYPGLEEAIDYWGLGSQHGYCHAPGNSTWGYPNGRAMGYVEALAKRQQAQGDKIFVYNGVYPHTGHYTIDIDGVNQRVNPWIFEKYDVDAYFLYHTHLYHNVNPFVENVRRDGSVVNGQWKETASRVTGLGNLFYPGTNLYSGQESWNYGLDGPIASIRMKNWRRGQQDRAYLWLAKQAGFNKEASEVVERIVSKATCDYVAHTPDGWTACAAGDVEKCNPEAEWANRGYQYEEARRYLAELLAGEEDVWAYLTSYGEKVEAGASQVNTAWDTDGNKEINNADLLDLLVEEEPEEIGIASLAKTGFSRPPDVVSAITRKKAIMVDQKIDEVQGEWEGEIVKERAVLVPLLTPTGVKPTEALTTPVESVAVVTGTIVTSGRTKPSIRERLLNYSLTGGAIALFDFDGNGKVNSLDVISAEEETMTW